MTDLAQEKFPPNPRLVFMGTPEFAIPALKALMDHGHELMAVVTQPDRPKGRGRKMGPPPVKKLAVAHGIDVLQPERASDPIFLGQIMEKAPDLVIVVAFGQLLKKNLIDIPKWGVINIHASLLPKYRGAAPIQWAIINNESKTGLTVMQMDEGMDTGPILFQRELPILKDETAGHLHDRMAAMSGDVIIETLTGMARGQINEVPQDEPLATYAPKIERGDILIDWAKPAVEISGLIRALDPRPGACTLLRGQETKLFSSHVVDEGQLDGMPGRVVKSSKGQIHVETGQGVIGIREIQFPGKRRLTVADFLRGFPLSEGELLGE
jgi:methionyl-tRNA formyltransferase